VSRGRPKLSPEEREARKFRANPHDLTPEQKRALVKKITTGRWPVASHGKSGGMIRMLERLEAAELVIRNAAGKYELSFKGEGVARDLVARGETEHGA
jgi:hypothetical protein